MIRVLKSDLEQLRFKLDQLQTSVFWMETYVVGLNEKVKQLKKFLCDLETVGTTPEKAVNEKQSRVEQPAI
jgi:hypothetical protein